MHDRQIRSPIVPHIAALDVISMIRGGHYDIFGGVHHAWDLSDPRGDAAIAMRIIEDNLRECVNEDEDITLSKWDT